MKNGTLKGKGLDLGAAPPRLNICLLPPPPPPSPEFSIIEIRVMSALLASVTSY